MEHHWSCPRTVAGRIGCRAARQCHQPEPDQRRHRCDRYRAVGDPVVQAAGTCELPDDMVPGVRLTLRSADEQRCL